VLEETTTSESLKNKNLTQKLLMQNFHVSGLPDVTMKEVGLF